ncbi:hypothetical protein NG895_03375 [Aeoliella sp. ICT_H6.2]|uniref:Uncharacterized protein n=1 Tax=Aeoliella straminimaris TaxID=2954799 RepID=A0A9X2JER3_9BACT|nr:hypothetical protein [Aeoliella straminimaris]MCO6042941.1 hypothetical protein [Aeoliella straminimaris]
MRRFRLWSLLLLTAVMAYLMAITSGPDEQIANMVLLTGVVLFVLAALGGAHRHPGRGWQVATR